MYLSAVLSLCCCPQAFSSCSKQGPLFVEVPGLLTAAASLVVDQTAGAQAQQRWLPGSKCGLLSSCGSRAPLAGFSAAVAPGLRVRAQQRWLPGSECGLSSGGAGAQLPQGMCGFFLGPGIKPVSPALTGGFLLTGAPRKPLSLFFQQELTDNLNVL